jgi:myosin-light-chain kinase
MSVTPGLGSFNKDKVANKFGIQLKNKETTKQSTEKKIFITETTTTTITMSDLNGFRSNTLAPNQKTLENSAKSKSNNELISTSLHNERHDPSNSNVNHSTISSSVKLNQSSDILKRSSLTSDDQTKSPEKRTSIPTNKTEAEIEFQKDQPLYKRQLSKTLDNTITSKTKHPYELPTQSNSRPDVMQQHGHHTHDVVLEDDIDLPFLPRIVVVKKNKSVTDEYDLMEILGRGKFGEVKKCREKSTQHYLAAKFIQINKEQDRIEALNEIDIMKALQHPRLLQLYDAFETKTSICLVMELINGGELFERVIDDDFILTERLCELYAVQICEGVNFIHSCNIIHLDMKPENILCVNRNGHRVKIIDFGLARKFDPTKQLKVLFGTPEFVAPEVINFDRVGFGTDMWSVGVICYVLLSGLSPFMGENDNDTYANINRANYDFDDEAFTDISDEAKDFISKLLIKDKDQRLSAKQCLAHPWLTRRPKSVSKTTDDENIDKKLSTKKLRRFVIRRRWQKAVNALLALQRMGMTL